MRWFWVVRGGSVEGVLGFVRLKVDRDWGWTVVSGGGGKAKVLMAVKKGG